MKTPVLVGVWLLVVALSGLGLLWPLLPDDPGAVEPATDPATITNYDATYRIGADGHLEATERLTVNLPTDRHGIFWFFPVADPTDPHLRIEPTVTAITMDDHAVPVSHSWRNGRSIYVAQIGDAEATVSPGVHTYVVDYWVDGVLAKPSTAAGDFTTRVGTNPTEPGSVFYWNVVGFWEMPIRSAHVVIELPDRSGLVQCAASKTGAIPCAIDGAGTDRVTVTAAELPARNPVTVRVDQPLPLPHRASLPWSARADGVLGRSVPVAGFVAVSSALSALAGFLWFRRSREKPPGLPVLYTPPDGLGPVQTVYIVAERVGDHALPATLLHLAERGLVRLDRTDATRWTVTGVGTPEQWDAVDPVTRQAAEKLGVATAGSEFVMTGSSGEQLSGALDALKSASKTWSRTEGLIDYAALEWVGRVLVCVCPILALIGFIVGPTMWGLPFALFAITGAGLWTKGVGTRRTAAGRQLWSRAGGFRRLLATPSSEDRFDYAARQDLFIAYIPYAAAFGVADKWAAKYRTATGQEPPAPTWFPVAGTESRATGLYSATGLGAFGAAVATSIAAYQAAQRSSSGSGGSSFSSSGGSWGGGGGSGGGSW
ncbi:DUF2207 domain-containing protein [Mycobacterium sp. pUA109]|uniref:DUF2207 domain-containing protein n=1 Tax=Mycobacterium sp. pUA109 TaxID=3238982 RepID=UPI00351BB20E